MFIIVHNPVLDIVFIFMSCLLNLLCSLCSEDSWSAGCWNI